MSLARLISRGLSGLEAYEVSVEVHLSGGIPAFSISGLPTTSVRESRDRVRAALDTIGFKLPSRRITVHLGPAGVPKDGGRFDLAIALGIYLAAQKDLTVLDDIEFVGELALDGEIRAVTGVLPAVLAARGAARCIVVPQPNALEAGLVDDADVRPAAHLKDVIAHLADAEPLARAAPTAPASSTLAIPDLSDVRGQAAAKRALCVAAAGSHNLLMIGSPGSGKSMLAERLRGLLPRLSFDEQLRLASIASLNGQVEAILDCDLAPFRSPHHTISAQALVGGGTRPRPGEVSLANGGVLFLDELPEFSRIALEALREPVETGRVRISRVREQVTFPARFQLIAAMNPCPCGYHADGTDRCECSPQRVTAYRSRISGPMLDRFDLHIDVPRVQFDDLTHSEPKGESARLLADIEAARERQIARAGRLNSTLADAALWETIDLGEKAGKLLESAVARWRLSARGAVRLLRTARTIADLAAADTVGEAQLAEAVHLRCLDRPAHGDRNGSRVGTVLAGAAL